MRVGVPLLASSLTLFPRGLVLLGRWSLELLLGQQPDFFQRLDRLRTSGFFERPLVVAILLEFAWVGLEHLLLLVAASPHSFCAGVLNLQRATVEEVVVRVQK